MGAFFYTFKKNKYMKFIKSFFSFTLLLLVISFTSCTKSLHLESEEGYVDVNGGEIWYKVIGEGNKTPLLLIHGGPGGTHGSFYELTPLSEDRPIILFDQLGTGRSGSHKDTTLLTIPNFVEQVHLLTKKLQLKDVYLLGHSWGAALELEYYQKHPENVKGIVFSSPYVSTPIWRADALQLIQQLPDSIQEIIQIAEKSNNYRTAQYQFADSVYWSRYGARTIHKRHPLDTVYAPGNYFIYNYHSCFFCFWSRYGRNANR